MSNKVFIILLSSCTILLLLTIWFPVIVYLASFLALFGVICAIRLDSIGNDDVYKEFDKYDKNMNALNDNQQSLFKMIMHNNKKIAAIESDLSLLKSTTDTKYASVKKETRNLRNQI